MAWGRGYNYGTSWSLPVKHDRVLKLSAQMLPVYSAYSLDLVASIPRLARLTSDMEKSKVDLYSFDSAAREFQYSL